MTDVPGNTSSTGSFGAQGADSPVWLARRRLLTRGLSVAPVLMVSAPRSVIAGTVACQTASVAAFTSVAPSGVAKTAFSCSGKTADYWKSCSLTYWPETCLLKNGNPKPFDDIFGSTNGFGPSKSLRDVLASGSATAKDKLAKQVVAALLNARKGLTPVTVLSEPTVKEIWAKCSAGLYYEPTAGVRWYIDYSVPSTSGGVMAWLQSTMSA